MIIVLPYFLQNLFKLYLYSISYVSPIAEKGPRKS